MLAAAKNLIREGRLMEARERLMHVEAHLQGVADPVTSFGLPRRLQSALLRLAKAEGDAIRKIAYQFHLVPPPERLAACSAFSADERSAMVRQSRMPVPRCIHQIWLGSKAVPPAVGAWADHAEIHGYGHRLWREADLVQSGYDRHPALLRMLDEGDYPGAVDVARYLILRDLGGIYLDCDWYPAAATRTFEHVLPMQGLNVFAEDTPRNTGKGGTLFANSFIATPPGNPVFGRLCDVLADLVEDLGDVPAWWSTGPLVFTVAARSGPVMLADAGFVAASFPSETPLADVVRLAGETEAEGGGLLIAWKSW